MFNANEAKKLVHTYRVARVSRNLDLTLDEIKHRAMHGETDCVSEWELTDSEYKLLEDLGFTVSRARPNRPTTITKW